MSLLMEALRKAEEAKRRALEKEQTDGDPGQAASPDHDTHLQTATFPPTDTGTEDEAPETEAIETVSFQIVDPPPKLTRETAGYQDEAASNETPPAKRQPEPDQATKPLRNSVKSDRPAAFREPAKKSGSSADLDGYFSGDPDMDDSFPPPANVPAGLDSAHGISPAGSTVGTGESNLDKYLAEGPDIDDAYPPPTTAHRVEVATEREKLAAASIFAAKRTAQQPPKSNRKMTIILGVMLVMIIPVGGGVFWYITSQTSSSLINPALSNFDAGNRTLGNAVAEIPDTAAGNGNPAGDQDGTATGLIDDSIITDEPDVAIGTVAETGSGTNPTQTANAVAALTANLTSTTEAEAIEIEPTPVTAANTTQAGDNPAFQQPAAGQAGSTADSGAPPAANNGLIVSRTSSSRRINPTLQNAYAMLQAGDLLAAGQLYEEVLADTPTSRDALLGIASVYSSQGNTNGARAVYARLLQLNPQDPLARTGLLQTVQAVSPSDQEAQLRKLMEQFPDIAPLTFAMGNFMAGQGRWAEAQEAYFNALLQARRSGSPVSPDYAFNLAVSLEQLGQRASALDYYRQAQTLMQQSKAGFDPALLAQRLSFLEGSRP